MSSLKNTPLFAEMKIPFAMTTLCLMLAACGGGGAKNTVAGNNTDSGADNICAANNNSCVNVVFDDTPVANLNFECGGGSTAGVVYRGVTDVTGVARCEPNSTVSFYLKSPTNPQHKVVLGSYVVKTIRSITSTESNDSTTLVRIGVKELAESTTGTSLTSLTSSSDTTATTAINLSRLLQTLRRTSEPYVSTAPVNRIYIDNDLKAGIDKMSSDVVATDFKDETFATKVKPWLDASNRTLMSAADVTPRLQTTIMATKAGSYFSTPLATLSALQSSTNVNLGISGVSPSSNNYSSVGMFTVQNRSGQNMGYGMQWSGATSSDLSTMYQLFLNSDFAKMRVSSLNGGIDPISNKFSNFTLKVGAAKYMGETSNTYGITGQYNDTFANGDTFSFVNGKLVRDFSVIGSADVYKLYTGVAVADAADLGTWQQTNGNTTNFTGQATLSKTGSVNTYLDPAVWRVKDVVNTGDTYLFPLYTTFTFKFPTAYTTACAANGQAACAQSQNLNVIFLENGDIVANDTVAASATAGQCTRDTSHDIPIGTVRAAYLSQNGTNYFVSPNIVISGASFGLLDGMQVGTSSLAGKVKINLAGLQNLPAGGQGTINATSAEAVTDSSGNVTTPDANQAAAGWVNGYNQFIQLHVNYAANNSSASAPSPQEKVLANLAQGDLSVNTASCYAVMKK